MKQLKNIQLILLFVFLVFFPMVQFSQVLNVPECTQEYDQWCWAGSSWSVLQYYGNDFAQCEIAEYTRNTSEFHDFGSVNCCLPSSTSGWACNYWNYNYDPDPGSIKMILIDMPVDIGNPSINNYGVARMLTEAETAAEIAAGRPFVIRVCCAGHFIVGRGYENGNLYYMDPWFGEGYGFGPYGSNVNGRTWTHTNIITLDPGPSCSIPRNLDVTSIAETSATLTWDSVELADTYEYRYKITSSGTWITDTVTATSAAISGLSAASEYEFQVKSLCPGGDSSDYSSSYLFNTDGCDTPTGLGASNIGDNSATISWNAIPEATSYELNYKISSASTWDTTTTSTTTVNLTGLVKATYYDIQVKSICSGIGTSSFSGIESFKTTGEADYCASSGGPGSYIDRVQVGALDNASGAGDYTDFSYTVAPVVLNPGTVSYTLETGAGTNYFMLWIDFDGDGVFSTSERLVSYGLHYQTSGTFTIPDVSITTRMRVSAKANSQQAGPCDTFSSGEVEDYRVTISSGTPTCDIPGNLSTSNITETSATLTWGAVTGATGYDVRYKPTASGTWTTTTSSSSSKDITGLTSGTEYEFQVSTVCASGSSAYSSSYTFTTNSSPVCGVPTNLTASGITENSATLSWDTVADATSYDIQYKETAAGTWTTTSSTTNSKSISGLNDGTEYEFQVRTVCTFGNSVYSSSYVFTTQAAPPADSVDILGSWISGLSHTVEPGTNRLLVFTIHVEDNDTDMNATAVTYGGQSMTKAIDENTGSGYRSYTAVYILDEAGITAAGGNNFSVTWSQTPSRTPSYSSVFLADVSQGAPIGDYAGNSNTSATLSTSSLSTNSGDLVIFAGACGNTGTYTVNNSFTEAIELSVDSGDGVTGYKIGTGADETPSVTHSNVNRQVLVGLVVQMGGGAPPDTTSPTPDPMTWASVPTATGTSSITMTATTASDTSGVEYFFEALSTGGHDSGWQDSPTYEDTGLSPDTLYSYRVKARDKSANQNETGWSASESATTDDSGSSVYCDSYGQSAATYIDYVEFGSFSNSSGAAGYTDFTNLTVNMTSGGSSSYRIEKGDSNSSGFRVWIDFNNDGDFDDSGERVVSVGMYNNYCYGSFNIPSGLNVTTRMRVSVKRNNYAGPCEVFSYGEVEDYTVVIQ